MPRPDAGSMGGTWPTSCLQRSRASSTVGVLILDQFGASGLVGMSSSRGCLSKPVPSALAGIGRVPFTEGSGAPFFFLTFLAYWSLHLCSGKGWEIQGSPGGT